MKAAVLTVSDSASAGSRADLSGPAVKELLQKNRFAVEKMEIVPDEQKVIEAALRRLAASAPLVVTTGGTGIAARDVTPEATLRVCEKVIPGFGEVMRAASLRKTAMAPLSRAMAATRGTALIVNLPGSESGARENLQAILHLIPHALQLLEGKTEH